MADQACKGLVVTADAIKNEETDPDNLAIDIDSKVVEEIVKKDENALKLDAKTPDDYIHNFRAWYDHVEHGKPFCVTCYNVDGKLIECEIFDTKGLQAAEAVEVEGYGKISFEGYTFNAASNMYMASGAALFASALAMLQ